MPGTEPYDSYQDAQPFEAQSNGHDLTFYPAGRDRLDALIEVIDTAQRSLKMFYYMFQSDAAGTKVRDAIARAAARGVAVHLLVDRFGTDAPESFFEPIVAEGGNFAVFSPKWSRRYLIRNHQKLLVADEETAMVGGFNVSDHYFASPADDGWCDLGCKMRGPAVNELLRWFGQLAEWASDSKNQFFAIRRLIKDWQPGKGPVRLTLGGPTRAPSNWARMVKRDLANASRLDMAMAYFSPPRSFRRLIWRIAKRGRVRLMLAGKSDNAATIAASRALYRVLLKHGARLFEFQPTKLHMKLIIVDDAVYFGSANFDHRSIRLNLELMLRFEDAALAEQMRDLITGMEAGALEVTTKVHRKRRTFFNELKWLFGWFLVTTVDYTVSRGLNSDD